MYEISESINRRLAKMLIDEIGLSDFFSGAVTCYDGEVECRLVCTVVVRRSKHNPRAIVGIAPVWWDLHSTIGQKRLCNDFSFNEMLSTIGLN